MKTLGRIAIILFAFILLSGLIVLAVNASGMNQPNFNGGGRTEFRPQGGDNNGTSFRPDGGEPEGRERGGRGGIGWIFGAVKNVGVITLLVLAIAWPRSLTKKNKKAGTISS